MTVLHANASAKTRDFVRNWIFGTWLLTIIVEPLSLLNGLPREWFEPMGVMIRFWPQTIEDILISRTFLYALKGSLIILLLCILINKRPKLFCVIVCLLLTIEQGLVRGFGNMQHHESVLLFAAYIMTLCDIADSFIKAPFRGKTDPNGIPLIMNLTMLCFSYAMVGSYRLIHGGPGIFNSDTIIYWIVQNSNSPQFASWHWDHLVFQYPWLKSVLKAGFLATTVLEILAPFCLINRRFRYVFVSSMVIFHVISWAFLGIFFWHQLALYILFFDLTKALHGRVDPRPVKHR